MDNNLDYCGDADYVPVYEEKEPKEQKKHPETKAKTHSFRGCDDGWCRLVPAKLCFVLLGALLERLNDMGSLYSSYLFKWVPVFIFDVITSLYFFFFV